ncbi:hypothetical protein GCM10022216_12000 [Sphingobacterium kyonggiense]|uniref:Uncharacterized protein n=1 Tax=Sphingobacterium kyonggiense TaxID=714075 RepID=A0ABP7YIR5_9SPHI
MHPNTLAWLKTSKIVGFIDNETVMYLLTSIVLYKRNNVATKVVNIFKKRIKVGNNYFNRVNLRALNNSIWH